MEASLLSLMPHTWLEQGEANTLEQAQTSQTRGVTASHSHSYSINNWSGKRRISATTPSRALPGVSRLATLRCDEVDVRVARLEGVERHGARDRLGAGEADDANHRKATILQLGQLDLLHLRGVRGHPRHTKVASALGGWVLVLPEDLKRTWCHSVRCENGRCRAPNEGWRLVGTRAARARAHQ
eukprot:scaffold52159_cov31-Tisochrysis_lutea.AAC.6